MGVGGQHHAPTTLPQETGLVVIVQEAGEGPRASLERCRKSCPTGIWSPDHPACSESLFILISVFLLYTFILTSDVESLQELLVLQNLNIW
jgi:hypothetical protein